MKKNLFTLLFIVSVVGVFIGIVLHSKWLDYVCKSLIMISIAGHFLLNSKNIDKNVVRIALIAFLFSLFGDSFLMFADKGNALFYARSGFISGSPNLIYLFI